jgi:hypothetical protein
MVIAFDVTTCGIAQGAFEVNTQVTVCPVVREAVVNAEEFVPAFIPLTFHW